MDKVENKNNSKNVIVVDSLMGSGKTTWAKKELLEKQFDKNFLYITPYLDDIDAVTKNNYNHKNLKRDMVQPKPMGKSKLDNIVDLLNAQFDIASTHELFRRFDDRCKEALKNNKYTLILDESLTAVEPYKFSGKQDFEYLINNKDIIVDNNGVINWIGSELNTRFDDVRILAKNKCLFQIDNKFYLWHFPHEIFSLFDEIYILTYMFEGSLMKYYFDLYNINFVQKSIGFVNDKYQLVEHYNPDKTNIRSRINIYNGNMNFDGYKPTAFSSSWFKSSYNKPKLQQLKNNFHNYSQNIVRANSNDIMWTCYKNVKSVLKAKGYTRGFVACNCRGTNDYQDRTCLMYGCNWYENPEIIKFFAQKGINVNQDKIALSTLLQWIWRSNIRVKDSNKKINIYIPSKRMRNLLDEWLTNSAA